MGVVSPPRPLEASDDREGFDCGRDALNAWLRRHALANHAAGHSRVSVICDAESGTVAGYVALSTGSPAK